MLIFSLFSLLQVTLLPASVSHQPPSTEALIELFDNSLYAGQSIENEWVKSLLATYPELYWYTENGVSMTQEGRGVGRPDSFSVRVLGVYYPELDRTLMVLKSLFLLINGSDAAYEAWIHGQKSPVLKRASFDLLVARVQYVSDHLKGLSREGAYQVWITALVLGDMGKTQAAHRLFESMGINVVDHDMFYAKVIHNEVARRELPSLARLGPKAQDLLVKTADLGHWGHISHLEGGFEMFEPLKHSHILAEDPAAFWFEAVAHSCDVAGAAGHVSSAGPTVYTENVYRILEAVYAACAQLKQASVADAYNTYMRERASWAGLPLDTSLDQVLVRLAAMLRLMDTGSGECLQQAAQLWTSQEQAIIVDALGISGANRLPVTPTYMPAVFANLASSAELGMTRCERLEKTIAYGVPWVARVLRDYSALLAQDKMSPDVPLNFNAIAGAVKVCPYGLNEFDGGINPETGAVELGFPALAH